MTAAPGNRSPGNRWQLHGLRHCLAYSARGLSHLAVPKRESFHPEAAWAKAGTGRDKLALHTREQVLERKGSVLGGDPKAPEHPHSLEKQNGRLLREIFQLVRSEFFPLRGEARRKVLQCSPGKYTACAPLEDQLWMMPLS